MSLRRAFWPGCAAVVALTAVPLSAHDFWLGASNWFPEPGTPFAISAGVGERFPARLDFKTQRTGSTTGGSSAFRRGAGFEGFERRDLAMAADVTLPGTAFWRHARVAPARST